MESEENGNFQNVKKAVSVVLVVLISYGINNQIQGEPNARCPLFKFNVTTAHDQLYIYDEDVRITNYKDHDSKEMEERSNQLRIYKGVIGTKSTYCIEEKYSFSVGIQYEIMNHVPDNRLLFQIGLSDSDIVDSDTSVGLHAKAWSVSGVGCQGKYVCFVTMNDNRDIDTKPLSENQAKTKVSTKLRITVIPMENVIEIYTMPGGQLLTKFKSVDFSVNLVPVFAVYNRELAKVSLTLLENDCDMQYDTYTLYPKLFIREDAKAIANIRLDSDFFGGLTGGELKKYRGVIGDISFTSKIGDDRLPYVFEIQVKFENLIHKEDNHSFEVGFSPFYVIDREVSLRYHHSLSVISMGKCSSSNTGICLKAWKGNTLLKEKEVARRRFDEYTTKSISIKFKLFPVKGKIDASVGDKLLHTFSRVDFRQPLYPVFGLGTHSKTSLILRTRDDFKRLSIMGYHWYDPVCDLNYK